MINMQQESFHQIIFMFSCFLLKFLSQQMSFLLTSCLNSDAGRNKPPDYLYLYILLLLDSLQVLKWANRLTSPFTQREPVKPNLRFISLERPKVKQSETSRSSTTTTTRTPSATPQSNRSDNTYITPFIGFIACVPTDKLVLTVLFVSLRGTCPSLCVTEETPSLKVHLTSVWPPRWTSTRSKFRV